MSIYYRKLLSAKKLLPAMIASIGLLIVASPSFSEEALSAAEAALQTADTDAQRIARAQHICEQIIISDIEPAKSQLIASLNGKTCAEVAVTTVQSGDE